MRCGARCGPGGGRADLRERDVAAIGEGGDDEAARVAHVLVRVTELGIADVDEAVLLLVVPAVLELRLPGEGERAVDLVVVELEHLVRVRVGVRLEHNVARVHVDGDEGLDLDALLLGQVAQHHVGVRGEPWVGLGRGLGCRWGEGEGG
eukprot:scaffold49143_cov40-Phaeocystis_antarctica.AAC.2